MGNRRLTNCAECGKVIPARYPLTKRQLCLEHAVAAALDAARQMHEHSGPIYERWLAAMNHPDTPARQAAGTAAAADRLRRRPPAG